MQLKNPLAAPDLDMQDIWGGQYALMNPICKVLWIEGFAYAALAIALYQTLGFPWMQPLCLQISLIWFAHIGFDRALGYGLKFPLGFRVTHLGVPIGMAPKA